MVPLHFPCNYPSQFTAQPFLAAGTEGPGRGRGGGPGAAPAAPGHGTVGFGDTSVVNVERDDQSHHPEDLMRFSEKKMIKGQNR